jgi:hypothetical protein
MLKNCILLLLLIVSAVVLVGCGGISEEQARAAALSFVKSRVKFYSQDPSYVEGTEEYDYKFTNSLLEEGNWVFFVNVSSTRLNMTKNALIRIAVDSRTSQVMAFEQIR